MTDPHATIGARVRAARRAAGYTSADAAAAALTASGWPVNPQQMQRTETGARRLTLAEAVHVAHTFGTTLDTLAHGVTPLPDQPGATIRNATADDDDGTTWTTPVAMLGHDGYWGGWWTSHDAAEFAGYHPTALTTWSPA